MGLRAAPLHVSDDLNAVIEYLLRRLRPIAETRGDIKFQT